MIFKFRGFKRTENTFEIKNSEGFLYIYDKGSVKETFCYRVAIFNSKCLLVLFLSSKNSNYKSNFEIEVKNSELTLNIMDLSESKYTLNLNILAENSKIEINTISKNRSFKNKNYNLSLSNCSLDFNCISIENAGSNNIKIDVYSNNSKVDVDCRVLIRGNATKTYDSKICAKGKSRCNLSIKALRLHKESKIVVIPSLEIEGNLAKADHSFALVDVDQEKLEYLVSRGIAKKTSINILVRGFLDEILNKIKDNNFKNISKRLIT